MRVGRRSALGPERAAEHLDRVVGRRLDRPERGPRGAVAQRRVAPPLVLRAPAPVEVGIVEVTRVGVEPLDRLLERVGRDAELLRQLGRRVPGGDPVRAGLLGSAEAAGEAVLVEPGLVERRASTAGCGTRPWSCPARGRRRRTRCSWTASLVKRLPCRLTMMRSRQRALVGEQLLAGRDDVGGQLDHRHPPRLAHVPEHRADAHGHLEPVAGVRLHGHRVRARPAQERALELGVVLEAAGGDHDVGRAHLLASLGRLEHDAGDLAVLHDQLDGAVAGLRLDAAVEAGLQQAAAERESHPALVVGGAALHLLGGELLRDRLAERRLTDREVVARVVRRDVDAVGPLAELAVGEDLASRVTGRPGACRRAARGGSRGNPGRP